MFYRWSLYSRKLMERSKAKHYHPVGLLSAVNRVLVSNRIADHLEKSGLLGF